MAFINEFISDEDWKKYNIQEIEDSFKIGNSSDDSWTIDKENNIFLKNVAKSRIDDYGRTWVYWVFFWENKLYEITTEVIKLDKDKSGQNCQAYKKIRQFEFLDNDKEMDYNLREKILPYLTEAFIAHGDAGVYSSQISYKRNYELELELDLA